MLGELITSKTRLRLMIKFFISQANRGYLNGLATEMGESTNAIRKELNHLQNAGYLKKIKVNNKVEYAIFTGQLALAEEALQFHIAKFKRNTGKTLEIFVFNKNKIRNSKKAIYMEEYKNDFFIDMEVLERFVKWLNK